MSTELTKRTISTGLGLGAFSLLGGRAAADTPFSGFAFPATGTTAPRTLPDRLAEIKNVKDFGATGNGVTDDWNAIQRAVNWTTGGDRGVIFFPPGTYRCTHPIVFNGMNKDTGTTGYPYPNSPTDPGVNLNIIFQGCGLASRLIGHHAEGFVLHRDQAWPSAWGCHVKDLYIAGGTGAVRMTGTNGGSITGVKTNSPIGFDACGAHAPEVPGAGNCYNINVSHCQLQSGLGANTYGIAMSTGAIHCCTIQGYDHGIRLAGPGATVTGCRTEINNVGVICGPDGYGNAWGAKGFAILGLQTESCNQAGIRIIDGTHGLIAGCIITANIPKQCNYGIDLGPAQYVTVQSTIVDGKYNVAALRTDGQWPQINRLICSQITNSGSGAVMQNPPPAL